MAALLTVAIWGTSFTFQKMALAQFNVSTFIALRYAGMLALSWCGLLYRLRCAPRSARIDRRDLPGLALAGVLGYGL
jgi:drug/metabolite transporter (DMT)-like permease